MNRKLMAFSLAFIVFVITCVATTLAMGLSGQLLFNREAAPKAIKIAQLPALSRPLSPPQQPAHTSDDVISAAAVERPVLLTATPAPATPTATVTPTALPTATPTRRPTLPPPPKREGVATRLVIPRLGLDSLVMLAPVDNGAWRVDGLDQTVGHLEGTAPPGSSSNIVLAGHVTVSAGVYGPFARLNELVPGDMLIVYENDKEFLYLVENRHTVTPGNVEVAYPTSTGKVTLITCTTWSHDENRYVERLVVRGRLIR